MAAAVGVASDVEWWNLTGTSSVIGTSLKEKIWRMRHLARSGIRLHEIETLKGDFGQNGQKSRRIWV